jgi:single-stranded-DNA-specific exonuclease
MLTTIDGIAKGSARSIANFNIYEALQKCEDLLIHFGGHQAAAGLAVELNKFNEFKDRFNLIVKESLNETNRYPVVMIDTKLKLSEITPKFLRILEQFAPFGPENMRPVFLSEGVEIFNTPRLVGNNHLVASFRQCGNDKTFDSIGFNMREYLDLLLNKKLKVDIVYSIDKTVRDGRTYPQLRLKDMRLADSSELNEKEIQETL